MIDFYSASLKLFTLALVLVFLASVIQYIAEGDSLFRTSLFGLSVFALIAGVGVFYNKLLLKVFSDKHKFNLDNYALKIGNVFPEFKDKLLIQDRPNKALKVSLATSDTLTLYPSKKYLSYWLYGKERLVYLCKDIKLK